MHMNADIVKSVEMLAKPTQLFLCHFWYTHILPILPAIKLLMNKIDFKESIYGLPYLPFPVHHDFYC
jgi:hypothetical protein